MATFNHEAFVAQAIDSVLMQRDVDLEFLIADDGSVDGTRDVVEGVRDDRVQFYPHETNRGACIVANELIQRATGEFVAIINSDDIWIGDDKLLHQLRTMQARPELGACFGRATFIDNSGRFVDKATLPFGSVFDQRDRSRGAWLRYFFEVGNCLCHPTMLIRKGCYDVVGLYDNRLRQLPDYDLWIRLVKRYDIHVSEREMVAFRHRPGMNASAMTAENSRRNANETYLIFRKFFEDIPREVFLDGFGDLLIDAVLADREHLDIEQALLYFAQIGERQDARSLIGIEKMNLLLGSDTHRLVLADRYGIDDLTFQAMTTEWGLPADVLDALHNELSERTAWALELNQQFVIAHRELDAAHRELDAAHRELEAAQRARGVANAELFRLNSSFAVRASRALCHPRSSLRRLCSRL